MQHKAQPPAAAASGGGAGAGSGGTQHSSKHAAFVAAVDGDRHRVFGMAGFPGSHGAGFYSAQMHSPFGQSSTPTSVAPQAVHMLMGHNPLQAQSHQQHHTQPHQQLATVVDEKRQQRLQRNRESARQSRKKKKQYMELLEQKVQQLQIEVDSARQIAYQNFASHAPIRTSASGEQEWSVYDDTEAILEMLHSQARGLILPRHLRLFLWLAARRHVWTALEDERISVARIGERHVAEQDDQSNVVVEAAGPLWPVLCHYLTLSVEQEERLRSVLGKLNTHSGSEQELQLGDALQRTSAVYEELTANVALIKQKMQALSQILDKPQLQALLEWAERRRLQQIAKVKRPSPDPHTMRKYRGNEQIGSLKQAVASEDGAQGDGLPLC